MIQDLIKKLDSSITQKCEEVGRDRKEIKVIAVSKTNPISSIQEVLRSGLIHFGENKAQELRDKAEIITEDLVWHFIGHLQTNKVKYVIKAAEYIHSIESINLAEEINKRAARIERIPKVFLEVNISGEESKFGLKSFDEIQKLADYCKEAGNLELCGLMTMAPYVAEETIIRDTFKGLKEYFDLLNSKGYGLTELSMGMTNDYDIAIEEGATMLRIGTAIFGSRDVTKSWKDK